MKSPKYILLAEKCLNKYWNNYATDRYGGGWDRGSSAHKWALRWAKQNIQHLKSLSFNQIFKEYKKILVQD